MANKEEYIRAFNGQIIGIIRYEDNGDKAAVEWPSRRVLGYYRKAQDHTTNFVGVVITKGDTVINFLYQNK